MSDCCVAYISQAPCSRRLNRQDPATVRPKRKKTPTGSQPDTLPGFSVTHRTVTSLRSRTVPSPTARKATVLLKESFLTGVAVAIVCARQLLSWQCPKGHFQDCRLSPTAHGRFLLSGLPPISRYSLTPNRRLLTLREVFHRSSRFQHFQSVFPPRNHSVPLFAAKIVSAVSASQGTSRAAP